MAHVSVWIRKIGTNSRSVVSMKQITGDHTASARSRRDEVQLSNCCKKVEGKRVKRKREASQSQKDRLRLHAMPQKKRQVLKWVVENLLVRDRGKKISQQTGVSLQALDAWQR